MDPSIETSKKILKELQKEKVEEEFHTDFAPDQFARWLSVSFPLFVAFLLGLNGQFTGGDVSCLPNGDLKNYSKEYSLPFSTQVNTYCGTKMIDFKDGKENGKQLYQHYFPYCLVFQAMLCSLPYVLWSVLAVGKIQSHLNFIQKYIVKHFNDNIEPLMGSDKDNHQALRSALWSGYEIKRWIKEWKSSKTSGANTSGSWKIIPILLSAILIAVYLWLKYRTLDIDESQSEFTCKVQDMVFKCVLSTSHLIQIIWWLNIIILPMNICIHVGHIIYIICGKVGHFFEKYLGIKPKKSVEGEKPGSENPGIELKSKNVQNPSVEGENPDSDNPGIELKSINVQNPSVEGENPGSDNPGIEPGSNVNPSVEDENPALAN